MLVSLPQIKYKSTEGIESVHFLQCKELSTNKMIKKQKQKQKSSIDKRIDADSSPSL